MTSRLAGVATAAGLLVVAACASAPAPPPVVTALAYPEYPAPLVPGDVGSTAAAGVAAAHETAWRRLQAGDLVGARRDYADVLRRDPGFYPAMTGLGFAWLADGEPETALERFEAALAADDEYAPAWYGAAEAHMALGHMGDAIRALERFVALEPGRDDLESRVALLRLRQVQQLVAEGRAAREAGRLDDADARLGDALELSPSSAVIFREIALVAAARGDGSAAEAAARRAVEHDPLDAEAMAALGAGLELQGRFDEAAEAFDRAAAVDPRPEWRDRAETLRDRARLAALPPEMDALADAPVVTRAQVAALVALRLEALIAAAPSRVAQVATDVRGHWAANWILPVTRAGVMEIYPNHTFQPATTVRRRDLAQVVTELLQLAAVGQAELDGWRRARPTFADLPSTNVYYDAAALAVSSGAMRPAGEDRFDPAGEVTGGDLLAAIDRIEQIARR